jgi:V8-like Glu-specific endopeptidase
MNKWDNVTFANLNEILANLYPTETDARRIATKSGLRAAQIDFSGSSIGRWFNVLDHANHRSKVDDVVAYALQENPDDDSLKRARDRRPPPLLRGPEATQWNGPLVASQLEKLMGARSTLVPITYLEIGLLRSRSVARVKRADGSSGTGFVTTGNKLITNNHVLPSAEVARSSILQFNYQQMADGSNAALDEMRLLPDSFFRTSDHDDWTAVAIEGDAPSRWGSLKLTQMPVQVGDHVNIIQHPGGGPKQISLFANVVMFVGGGRIQYLTDTLPGSSGSPVFDVEWNVIALHHSGGWLTEPNADSKLTYYRNEGIAVQRIIEGLAAKK